MSNEVEKEYPKPEWDEAVGKSYVGKYILVGVTYRDRDGEDIEKKQFHGVIKSASEEDGIEIQLKGIHKGESWIMPPDQRAISKARPGTYTLRESGEEIEDPDLLSTWIIERPTEEEST